MNIGAAPASTERLSVEMPLVAHLRALGWDHIEGDTYNPEVTERTSFRQVLLYDQLRAKIRAINTDAAGEPWLDDARIDQAIGDLERASERGGLVARNRAVFDLLTRGALVEGNEAHDGRDTAIAFIDFAHPERNHFVAINQFRVDPPGPRESIIPDIVLFVNGIPLVVIECKSASITDPIEAGIYQLLRYSNQRGTDTDEGVERLFDFNALMVSTDYFEAVVGTVGSQYEHYAPWSDTEPMSQADAAAEIGKAELHAQELLAAGALRPTHLLDLVYNFTVFDDTDGVLVKKVARYQQYRVVVRACEHLQQPPDRTAGRREDGRGGVVWHTQGSGKSLSMVFLVRRMRVIPALKAWKVVIVTDRKDLQRQLGDTAAMTGEVVEVASSRPNLIARLGQQGGLLMAMIQKYRPADEPVAAEDLAAEGAVFPVCNESDQILLLVDEAHRGYAGPLHANLIRALPNAAKIAFTGTPILMGEKHRTHEIFGAFLDVYTIKMSETDKATVPIIYEGRESRYRINSAEEMDAALAAAYPDATPAQLEVVRRRYARQGAVLEAPRPIDVKAADMLRHYVDTVLPNGLKAQVVGNSRRAAIRYQAALSAARDRLVADLESHAATLLAIPADDLAEMQGEEGFRARAFRHLPTLRRLKFAAVISGTHNDEPELAQWSAAATVVANITAFKKPLTHEDPAKESPVAFLCVKSMLLTGFDAPVEQVVYLDRPMQGAELLQAIARVNRTRSGKTHGLIVDYVNLGTKLSDALDVYASADVEHAVSSIADELPRLEARYARVLGIFGDAGLDPFTQFNECVDVLVDTRLRSTFGLRLREFLEALDTVLPRPEALRYMRPAKVLGKINQVAAQLYRDRDLRLIGAGRKVQGLIDAHLDAEGVDRRIEPVSILDARFDSIVADRPSPRTKASEMEHAARHHITVHFAEDPALYRKLSDRLQTVLDAYEAQWDQLVLHLGEIIETIRTGEAATEATGLDPRIEAPFWRVLAEGIEDEDAQQALVGPTRDLVDLIRGEVTALDFGRNMHAQEMLRAHIYTFLDVRNLVPYERLNAVADELMDIARQRRGRMLG